MPENVQSGLKRVKERIEAAALSAGHDPKTVKLVAVSKTVSADRVLAAIKAGATDLGENYVQEAREKIEALKAESVS